MKTAVEWYSKAVIDIYNAYIGNEIDHEGLLQNLLNAKLQAKEMEKQQIISAYEVTKFGIFAMTDTGILDTANKSSEQYYNETYKK